MKRIAIVAAALALVVCLAPPVSDLFAQAGSAQKLSTSHDGNILYPLFSPDGAWIAYEVNYPAEKKTELFRGMYDGSGLSGADKLVPESMASSGRYGAGKRITHGFAWAPTGSYGFAYGVSDATGMQNIYIDNWSAMISSGSANKNPNWDPTSSRFVFSSGRTGNGDLYLWDGNGGAEIQLTYDEKNAEIYPVFDSSGSKVAYVRQGKAGSHIYILDVNMFSTVALVQHEGKESTRPTWSPDGSKVAFFSNKATDSVTEFGLWVTDSRPGGTPRNIAPKAKLPSKGGAMWTPDGKGVIAVQDNPDTGDPVCIFPVDGGSPNCLQTGTRVNRDPQLLVIDGQWRLLFTAQQQEGQSESEWQELYVYSVPH